MSGTGWSCTANTTCTRSDTLGGGTSYPPITVAVNVGTDGPSQVTNQVTLTGGGQALATGATDTATIVANPSTAVVTTVSAASGTAPVTADSIVSLYGVNISTAVYTASAGPPAPLPPALGGVSATITDSSGKTAPIGLIVVTPNQVNAVLPAGLETGEATITDSSRKTAPIGLIVVTPNQVNAVLPAGLETGEATITDSSGKTAPIGLIVVTPNQVNAVLPAGLETGEATITDSSGKTAPIGLIV